MVIWELDDPFGEGGAPPLGIRLPIQPGDYMIITETGDTVEIKRCVRADGDPTWSSGSAVSVTDGAFTIAAVADRQLLADIVVTSSAPIEVCRVESV